jgi:hypothetical protein
MPAALCVAQVGRLGASIGETVPYRRKTEWEREGVTPSHLCLFYLPLIFTE